MSLAHKRQIQLKREAEHRRICASLAAQFNEAQQRQAQRLHDAFETSVDYRRFDEHVRSYSELKENADSAVKRWHYKMIGLE